MAGQTAVERLLGGLDAPDTDVYFKRTPVEKEYTISWHKLLGEGSYGTVYECQHIESKELRAVKVMDRKHWDKAKREVELQCLCAHRSVVRIFDVYDVTSKGNPIDPRPERPLVFIVMELMCGGELFHRIRTAKRFTESDASAVMRTLATAVHHCHKHGVAHRDLKPENILLKTEDTPAWECKLADFGFARNGPLSTPLGAGFYTSPEMVKAIRVSDNLKKGILPPDFKYMYDVQSDMWTLGVILYVLLVGYPPYSSKVHNIHRDRGLQERILQADFKFEGNAWKTVSPEAKALVCSLMTLDPRRRMTSEQLVAHPWITGEAASPALELLSPAILGGLSLEETNNISEAIRRDIQALRQEVEGEEETKPGAPGKPKLKLESIDVCLGKLAIDRSAPKKQDSPPQEKRVAAAAAAAAPASVAASAPRPPPLDLSSGPAESQPSEEKFSTPPQSPKP